NFPLVHEALFVIVQEFDRVLDRYHVFFTLVVDLVEHGREGRGFTRTGGACNQHESARLFAKPANDWRKTQCVERFNFPWNRPEDGRHGAALMENVSAKARQTLQSE